MFEKLRNLGLLLYKNYIVHKRHWFGSIIEFFFPLIIIAAIVTLRSTYDIEPVHVQNDTYFPILTKSDLINDHIPKSMLHLYYKPRNNFTDQLMKDVTRCAELPYNQLFGFNNEDDMMRSYEIQQVKDELISVIAIDFDGTKFAGEILPKKLIYSIKSSQPIPDNLFDFEGLSEASDILITEIPIVPLQMCLNDVFIDDAAPDGAIKPTVVIQKMPYPPYDNINSAELSIQNAIRIFGGVLFFATICLIPSYITAEKTTGVNTLLKMNGVKSYENFFSWLVSGMIYNIVPIFLFTMFFNCNLYGQKPIYYHSDWIIIWLSLFINVTHVYSFCIHVASYFSKAWLAQIVATTVVVLFNISATQLENTVYFTYVPLMGIFCPSIATTRMFDELNKRENELTGAHWSNIFETVNPSLTNRGSLGSIMLFSILGIICHFILAVYLDAVLPSKYDVQKSPLFFLEFFANIWKKNKVANNNCSDDEAKIIVFEKVDQGAPSIELKKLAKYFMSGLFPGRCGKIEAIRGISMGFYKGVITALLGHNGAGKTTTLSILTGSMAPSKGTASINGKDINKNLDTIRSDLGVCTQENLMFSDLTVAEQLQLIGSLKRKNKSTKKLIHDVNEMLDKLNITEKRDSMPDKLSGGQKRRLCLGMALIGDASTMFLDEPTSGMDPETRRGTWDLLLKYRNQKTIIITTHCMEEADVLGDRIAIMHSGRMKCYATSMYLKKFYGHNCHEVTLSTTSNCNETKIREMIGSDAKMAVTHHGRIVISIPITSSLPEILDNMESQKAELGITGVSVSMITLEQVFLKAAEEEGENTHENGKNDIASVDYVDGQKNPDTKRYEHLTGSDLKQQKINALLKKKATYFKKDTNLFIAMIFGALLAVLLPAFFDSNDSNKTNSQSLDLGLYQAPEALIYSKNQILGDAYKKFIESQGGIGTLTQAKVSLSNELLSRALIDLTYYKTRMIIAGEFNSSLSANGLYSGGATLSAPITLNAMSNLVLKTLAGDQYSIVASIGDLPQPLKQDAKKDILTSVRIIRTAILSMTLFFHIVALFVKHPLLENSTKVKQLQKMAGVSAFLYWGTTFIIDYLFYILLTIFTVSGIFLTDFYFESNTMCSKEIGILLLLFLLFGINALLFVYIHSFMKKRFHLVYSILSGVPLFLAFFAVTLNKVLPYVENAENASTFLRRIFSLQPHTSFVLGYLKFAEIASDNARCRGLSNRLNEAACAIGDLCCDMKCSDGYCANPMPYFGKFTSEGGLEEFVLYLLLTPIILVGILCLLEQQTFAKWMSKLSKNEPKPPPQDKKPDCEVGKEESIVRKAINQRASEPDCDDGNVFLAHELSKCYGKLEAVKEVNFRVKKNECFGLLGVNGAGKSTTFRMLVGEEVPTSGILYRGPYSIKNNRTEYLKGMGYCPQNDALIPYFNAVEQLSLFASLRGIPNSKVASEVHSWIDKLRLSEHAKNPSGSYSGGNKRRLNIAMALIGDPELVLLDEPTTGVDPAARRLVWTILQSCQASGQALVLTSHSMEECEALCNRIAIMARGRILCVGATQELKERHGAGFNIVMKLNPERSEEDFNEIKRKLQTTFHCELKDEHPGCLFYHITDSSATWVKMFGTMNNLKSEYECIEDFTVSTSTLEQLFIQFARSSDSTVKSHTSNHEVISV